MSDAEIVIDETGQELAVVEPQPPTLFGTADPAEVIIRATAAAGPLAEVVRKQKLTSNIKGKEHVRVEGWTLLGSMLGVFPVCVWTRKLENGWEARTEARTRDGAVVGAAEAMCTRDESTWANRDEYAIRSMAQTRSTSKAMRQPLGFVMQLAGFEATPYEEMPADTGAEASVSPSKTTEPAKTTPAQPKAQKPAQSALQTMRRDIEDLVGKCDRLRAAEPGTTFRELDQHCILDLETPFQDLTDEDEVRLVGEKLGRYYVYLDAHKDDAEPFDGFAFDKF